MIVQIAWMKIKKCRVGKYTSKTELWRGLFLFGIIPLYLWMVDYEYTRD